MKTKTTYTLIITLIASCFLTVPVSTRAQKSYSITPSFESLISTGDSLPFWLTHNQYGRYPLDNNPTQFVSLKANFQQEQLFNTPIKVELGTDFIGSYSTDFQTQLNELFAKAYLWGWKLEVGLFHEPEYLNGISSTNGNLDRSNNARPYPRIRFGTDEFIPVPFAKKVLSFKAEYDEGLLNDERYVMNTKFHHKSLYIKGHINDNMALSFGLNHYVMWGGLSSDPRYGQLPEGFKNYLVYITGSQGTEDFPQTDQLNVAGNQFGTYLLQYEFEVASTKFNLYINHPFEDHGGMEMKNPQDNLYGIYANFGDHKLIESVVYEYLYTLYQSGSVHGGTIYGMDDYFNHGVYRSGYTYKGYTMASPLFGPLNPNLSRLIENTRILMHHIGAAGSFTNELGWDMKLTSTKFYGTYQNKLLDERKQFSGYLNLDYQNPQWPVDLSLSLATDFGEVYSNNFGAMLKVSTIF